VRFRYTPTQQEALVPIETRTARAYSFGFDDTNGVETGVATANLTSSAVTVAIVIRDNAGTQIGTGTLKLSAHGHDSFLLSSRFASTVNSQGTIEFSTAEAGQISVLGLRFPPSLHFSTIPVAANTDPGNGIISHLAVGGGWSTVVEIVNTNASPAPAQVSFFKSDGTPFVIPLIPADSSGGSVWNGTVPAHGRVVLLSTGLDSDPVQIGSAQLSSGTGLSGFVRYRYAPADQELIAPLESRQASSYFISFDNTSGSTTGVAVANASASPADIPVTIYDELGNILSSAILRLPSTGQTAFVLPDRYASTGEQRGTIQFATPLNGSIGVLGIHFPPSGAFTTIPPAAP